MEYYKNLSLASIQYYDTEGNLRIEQWKDILDYEGVYQASDLGRIKSLRNQHHKKTEKILKQIIIGGYSAVSLHKQGKRNGKIVKVHRLVALAFIPNPENKPQVNHKDLNKQHNYTWNLEWMTSRENQTHYQLTKDTVSQYTGVTWLKKRGKWLAQIMLNGRKIHLGLYATELEAHHAYQKALTEINEGVFVHTKKRGSTSLHKGVCWNKNTAEWKSMIYHKGRAFFVGYFKTELEAFEAREKKYKELGLL